MEKPDIRICFVGDSIINGTGDPDCLGWTGRVCSTAIRDGYNVTLYNLGIRRNTSTDVAARWLAECEQRLAPEHDGRIVFSFGTNDTMLENGKPRLDQQATLKNARQILSLAQSRYRCLWIGPASIADAEHNQRLNRLCNAFQVLASELCVPYLPVLDSLLQSQTWMQEINTGDGAHPQVAGYSALAALVQNWDEWWFNQQK